MTWVHGLPCLAFCLCCSPEYPIPCNDFTAAPSLSLLCLPGWIRLPLFCLLKLLSKSVSACPGSGPQPSLALSLSLCPLPPPPSLGECMFPKGIPRPISTSNSKPFLHRAASHPFEMQFKGVTPFPENLHRALFDLAPPGCLLTPPWIWKYLWSLCTWYFYTAVGIGSHLPGTVWLKAPDEFSHVIICSLPFSCC